MKSLFELCKPRQSVFDEKKREDVLKLSDLIEGNINPSSFFEENYLTDGMSRLFEAAFERFMSRGSTGVIKLTQAMGGGKTHNMLALGLLAAYPEYRDKVMKDASLYKNLGKVKVVAFNGRESDAPLGIWGSIAEQLGKKEVFNQHYQPLAAPGESSWINLLSGEPTLILIDELPPYLENAKSRSIGNSDLCVVTTNALSNLFSALANSKLSNICVVISDLKAAYESGSEYIQSTFKNLENELERSCLNIEPVGSTSDDIYHILRKRLFVSIPEPDEINDVAKGYREAVLKANQMELTNAQPERIYAKIKDSYPFHPSIRDLYARFKENQGFQQTRGLIRLMRQVVIGLYKEDAKKAKQKYLINIFDIDLNDKDALQMVTQINTSLSNAIAHDISSNGKAIAEEIDRQQQKNNLALDIAKTILVSSLANVKNAVVGLTLSEIAEIISEPGRDINGLKKALESLKNSAWYLDRDKEGKFFFMDTKNMNAELNSYAESYSNDEVKTTTLKKLLEEKFKPQVQDCYQELLIFPALDQINLVPDKVTLVLFEPYTGMGLQPDLMKTYENTLYKNRVMFLSGQRDTMKMLYKAAKELKAIERIISEMEDRKISESNHQYQLAQELKINKTAQVLSAAQQTFGVLYYPNKNGIQKAELLMEFKENKYNGEDQIRSLLKSKQKLNDDAVDDNWRRKCEDRLFTRKQMKLSEIKERAATETSWQWHHPNLFDTLLEFCKQKDLWRLNGDYIEKGPFEKEPTGITVTTKSENKETGKVVLKLMPLHGDTIYYEVGSMATQNSPKVDDPNNFETSELKVSFLCVDSKGEHPTGKPYEWIREIKIYNELIDTPNGKKMKLQTNAGVKLKFTTDGSEPKEHGKVYEGDFIIPYTTSFVLVVAEYDGKYYSSQTIKVDSKKTELEVAVDKPLTIKKTLVKASNTQESYSKLDFLKKYAQTLGDIHIVMFRQDDNGSTSGYIEININDMDISPEELEVNINNIRNSLIANGCVNVEFECGKINFTTGQAFYDYVNEQHISLSKFKQEEIIQ